MKKRQRENKGRAHRLGEPGRPVDRLQLRGVKVGQIFEVVEEELLEVIRGKGRVRELKENRANAQRTYRAENELGALGMLSVNQRRVYLVNVGLKEGLKQGRATDGELEEIEELASLFVGDRAEGLCEKANDQARG